MDDETVGTNLEPSKKADGTPEYDPEEWSAPPKKCPRTGRFLPGTGSSLKGGRPQGAKDKLSVQFLDVMQAVIEEKGTEMMMRLAEENPAAALAIISRSLPQKAMQEAIDGVEQEGNEITQVSINLVAAPTPRKIEGRTEQEISDQQRGLNSPVERIKHEPEAATEVVADQVTAEVDEAAEAEKERVARQNEAIRAHGGLTGVPSRASRVSTAIEYPDDESWV